VASRLPVARVWPEGLKAPVRTSLACPRRVTRAWQVEPRERLEQLALGHVPDPDRPVFACRSQPGSVARECEVVHVVGVAAKRGQLLASGRVPKEDGAVDTARGEQLPVGGKRHAIDHVGMPLQ
jgi:hypothetical protein